MNIKRAVRIAPTRVATISREGLDKPLDFPAEIQISTISGTEELALMGVFERRTPDRDEVPTVYRGTGGPTLRVSGGTVHVSMMLTKPDELVPCAVDQVINRYVRPLLRALTRLGATAHYFGRDWVSVARRPASWVGVAHDSVTKRTLLEAYVGVKTPFATVDRASYRGTLPGSLEEIAGRPYEVERVADAIAEAYRDAYAPGRAIQLIEDDADTDGGSHACDPPIEPPWSAECNEAMGKVCAGYNVGGAVRVGGDFFASRDTIERLHQSLDGLRSTAALGDTINAIFGAPGVLLMGVASLESFRTVIEGAVRQARVQT